MKRDRINSYLRAIKKSIEDGGEADFYLEQALTEQRQEIADWLEKQAKEWADSKSKSDEFYKTDTYYDAIINVANELRQWGVIDD